MPSIHRIREVYFMNTPLDTSTLLFICVASCRADNENDNGIMWTHKQFFFFADVMQFPPSSGLALFLCYIILIYYQFSFFVYFHLFTVIKCTYHMADTDAAMLGSVFSTIFVDVSYSWIMLQHSNLYMANIILSSSNHHLIYNVKVVTKNRIDWSII